jgi:HK97 family phage major capsid protein
MSKKFAAMTLDELEAHLTELKAEAKDLADAEASGDVSEDDLTRIEDIYAETDEVKRVMTVKRRLAEERQTRGRQTPGEAVSTPRRAPSEPRSRNGNPIPATARNPRDEATHGFRSLGHFAQTVGRAARARDESAINHLTMAATTYSTESTGSDGGWLVPPEFSDAVWKKINGVNSLLPMCAAFQTSRNSLSFPKDETTPWDNSAGITVYWESEGGAGTEAKAKFEIETARLNKLMSLIKVTEELLEDAAGLDSYLRMWAPVKMTSRINTAIVRGNGVGKPLGIVNSGSLITVSKETSQDAATIIYPNINKMWSRLYAELRSNAVWLINQECEPMLNGMAFIPAATQPGGSTTMLTSYTPVYLPAGSIAGQPYGTLYGRPVIPMQPCSALGTIGDILLTDLSQYMALTKTTDGGAPRVDTSIHLHFDQAIDTYRFIFRMTGQPLWNSTISPENGSTTYSWAVALETRS